MAINAEKLKEALWHLPTSINEIGRVRIKDALKLIDKLNEESEDSNTHLTFKVSSSGVDIIMENEHVALDVMDTKQALINNLILSGVLADGETVRSMDE